MGDLLVAIFGWSVTALFGKLPGKKQIAVSGALGLSVAWPVFVVGLLFPAVAGWALAFLPLEAWLGPTTLRVIWASLAIVSPLLVGLCVHWAAPATKGSLLRTLVAGYPLALGLFLSFLITAVSVPVLKVIAIVRGWTDTHVYVQPRVGSYRRVVRELAEACARAGLMPEIAEPPKTMTLAFRALRFFAQAAVMPIVAEEVLAIRAPGLSLVAYPSDLLLRGKPVVVARVRAMLGRTDIDADAYLVEGARAQELQDELGRLRDVIRLHEERGQEVGAMATKRLGEIWQDLTKADLPYDEWVMLESITHRIERHVVREHLHEPMPLDRIDDGLAEVAREANVMSWRPVTT